MRPGRGFDRRSGTRVDICPGSRTVGTTAPRGCPETRMRGNHMKLIKIEKPKPTRPVTEEDHRTPSGRMLPY